MTKKRLLLATTNRGKLREIKIFFKELPLDIYSLNAFKFKEVFPEKGETFSENAEGKSLFYSMHWEGFTVAEDSGLEIEHLGGKPGVLSARFSGPQATDETNIQKVLRLLKGVPFEQRNARFISCMVLSQKGKIFEKITESVQGYISFEKKGVNGFGYDPIFFYAPLKKTFAQLRPEEKNNVSHRGRALKKMRHSFQKHLKSNSLP